MLSAHGVGCSRSYRQLFTDFNLELRAGHAVQIAGENGAGKTTLLKTLCGLRRPDAGKISWREVDVHEQPSTFGDELLYIGHENALNPDLTPQENLSMWCGLFSGKGDIGAALVAMGLPKTIHRPCRALSAGQRRRVALARLSLSPAPLWILDEPAAALDTAARDLLAAQIANHVKAGRMAIFTTHESLVLPGIEAQHLKLRSGLGSEA